MCVFVYVILKKSKYENSKKEGNQHMFFYTGVSNQMYKDKYKKKRDRPKTYRFEQQKKIIFQNLSKIM